MLRRLRVLAAFFMVPVVVLANPSTAAAAGGEWQQIHVSMDVVGSQDWVNRACTFNARNDGSAIQVGNSGYCTGLSDSSPGTLQPGEAGSSFTFTFDGADDSGAECGATYGGTLGQHSLNGTIRVAGSVPAGSATITGGAGDGSCIVTEVCIRLMNSEFACGSFTLEPPEPDTDPVGSACPYGTPRLTNPQVVLHSEGSSSYRWIIEYDVVFAGEPPPGRRWTATNYNSRTGVWRSYPLTLDRLAGTSKLRIGENLQYAKAEPKPDLGAFGSQGFQFSTPMVFDASGAEVPSGTAGATTWNNMANGTSADNFASAFAAPSTQGGSYAIPPLFNHYYGGWTDPAKCRFWVGPKVLNVENSDADEPSSLPGEPLPTDPPDPVEPVIEEPDPIDEPETDLGWLGMIWAVLQSIWGTIKSVLSAIKSLVSGIVNGIIDGLTDLFSDVFVPSDGYLESKWDAVEAEWAGTSPGRYLDTLSGFNSGAVSGCGGLPLDVTLPGGVQVSQSIGAACSGTMATAAGITRAAVTAVFAVGGLIACVRAVGSGLGWNPGIGRGDAS